MKLPFSGFGAEFNDTAAKLVMVAVFLMADGCATGIRTSGMEAGGNATATSQGQTAESKYVIINNKDLAQDLQVVSIDSKFVDDLLIISVSVFNKYDATTQVQYSYTWYDDHGMEVGSTHWTPVVIYGNETKSLKGVAPNKKARTYRVHIRKL